MKKELIEKVNRSLDKYTVLPMEEVIKNDKGANVNYWGGLEETVEEFIKSIASDGGIKITEIGDLDIVKEVTEFIVEKLEKRFPEAEFPYVDQDF